MKYILLPPGTEYERRQAGVIYQYRVVEHALPDIQWGAFKMLSEVTEITGTRPYDEEHPPNPTYEEALNQFGELHETDALPISNSE